LEHNAKPSVKNNAKKLFCLLLALLYYFCTKKASKVYLFYKPNRCQPRLLPLPYFLYYESLQQLLLWSILETPPQ